MCGTVARMLSAVPQRSRTRLHACVTDQVRAFTWTELAEIASESAVRRLTASGGLIRVLPGVYAAPLHAESFHVRAHAALIWAGADAAISGLGALFLWGILDEPPDRIEIMVRHGWHKRAPGWLKARRATFPVDVQSLSGLVVVSAADAVIQGYSAVTSGQRAEVVYSAARRRLTTADALIAAMARTPRVRARKSLEQRVVGLLLGVESYLEERGHRDVFNTAEFAHLIWQHEVVIEGYRYRLDLYDPTTRTAIELDGGEHHGSTPDRQRDVNRDARLATIGILTLRFTYWDIVERPEWCREVVRDTLAARRR